MAEVKTFRPQGSSPELERPDLDELVGKLVAVATTVERDQERIEAWRKHHADEHSMFAREVSELGRTVAALVDAERETGLRVRRATRAAPVVLFAIELARQVWEYLQATGAFR